MNHLSSRFPDPKGTRLRYQYWEASAKSYNRILLLLHGLGRHSGSYPSLMPPFLEAGYKIYALDFAGFGASPGERGAGGVVAMADAVESLCRRIESAEGARAIDIVAHSMGAVAAFLFLKRYPARRARLAALSPLFFGAPMDARLEAFAGAVSGAGPAGAAPDAAIPGGLAAEIDATVRALLADPGFLEGRSAAFFVGDSDPLVPLDRLEAAVAALPLEDKRVVRFSMERHDPLAGGKAGQVARAILRWFYEARSESPAP